jgi:uncharacterized DUF497 family protein
LAYTNNLVDFDKIEGFEWDDGNKSKNPGKHNVSNLESEQIFFNELFIIADDEKHSTDSEKRYYGLGKTDNDRYLFTAFTIRKDLIRIISARDMSPKERKIYNEKTKENT